MTRFLPLQAFVVILVCGSAGCASSDPIDDICGYRVDLCHTSPTREACETDTQESIADTARPEACLETVAQCTRCLVRFEQRGLVSSEEACGPFTRTICPEDCTLSSPNPCAPACTSSADCTWGLVCVSGGCDAPPAP